MLLIPLLQLSNTYFYLVPLSTSTNTTSTTNTNITTATIIISNVTSMCTDSIGSHQPTDDDDHEVSDICYGNNSNNDFNHNGIKNICIDTNMIMITWYTVISAIMIKILL